MSLLEYFKGLHVSYKANEGVIRPIKNKCFVIVADELESKRLPNYIIANLKKLGYNSYFTLYDDDGVLYYKGYLHEACDDAFAPLDWAMADSGCTEICYRGASGKMETL
jgi:hypothetical protein